MAVPTLVRSWMREHPLVLDVLLAAAVLGSAALPYFDELRDEVDGQRPAVVIALLVVASFALVWRRSHPWWVWGLTTALGLAGVLLAQSPSPVYLPAVVALYTVAARYPNRDLVGPAALSILSPTVMIVALSPLGIDDDRAYEMVWWAGLATATGIAVRNQRWVVAAADARARAAETSREEEASRRVTEERLRIARELHDVVAHHVAVINVQAGVARQLLDKDSQGAAEALGHVRESSQTVMREVPGMLGLLRTGEDQLDTSPAPRLADVTQLVEQARRSGLEVVWRSTGTPRPLAAGTDLTAYRVVQEGLTNATRHGAGKVMVRVAFQEDGLSIELRNEQAVPGAARGTDRHGLVGMRERVISAGGTLSVGPEGINDWVVRARLPVDAGIGSDPLERA